MRIFIGQIYIRAGVTFPFSLAFQEWLGAVLSERVQAPEKFNNTFGADFELGLRISAKAEIDYFEIKGPTVFKRDKSVEFTIFLPYRPGDYYDRTVASRVVVKILQATIQIYKQLGLDPANLTKDIDQILAEFLSTPGLLDARKHGRAE